MSQLLTETLVVAIAGGGMGVAGAYAAVDWFNRTVGHRIERFWVDVSVDGPVLSFAVGLVVVATVMAGLVPARQSSRLDMVGAIKDHAMSSFRMGQISRLLIIGQVAFSAALLLISGLMIKGVIGLSARDMGFERRGVMTARTRLAPFDYPTTASLTEFVRRFYDTWSAQPDQSLMAISSRLPGLEVGASDIVVGAVMADEDGVHPRATVRSVTPEFFSVFELGVRSGRMLDRSDRQDANRVAIVNTAFVEQVLSGDDPIGRMISLTPEDRYEVVGVVDDLGATVRDRQSAPGIYVPFVQRPTRDIAVAVRMPGLVDAVGRILRAFDEVDRNLAVYDIAGMQSVIDDQILPERTFGVLFGAFGAAGLVLAMVGLYGVMSFVVGRGTREIGLRRALGARSRHVVALTVRPALIQIGVGLVLGTALAALVAPIVAEFFFGADPRDPMIYGLVTISLALTALFASLIPSIGAASVSPMTAFRAE